MRALLEAVTGVALFGVGVFSRAGVMLFTQNTVILAVVPYVAPCVCGWFAGNLLATAWLRHTGRLVLLRPSKLEREQATQRCEQAARLLRKR